MNLLRSLLLKLVLRSDYASSIATIARHCKNVPLQDCYRKRCSIAQVRHGTFEHGLRPKRASHSDRYSRRRELIVRCSEDRITMQALLWNLSDGAIAMPEIADLVTSATLLDNAEFLARSCWESNEFRRQCGRLISERQDLRQVPVSNARLMADCIQDCPRKA